MGKSGKKYEFTSDELEMLLKELAFRKVRIDETIKLYSDGTDDDLRHRQRLEYEWTLISELMRKIVRYQQL